MPSRFDTLTLADADKLLATVKLTAANLEAIDFYNGEMWRNGDGWIGQKPPTGAAGTGQLAAIAAGYVSQNVVREVVERHVAGVLGREPRWSFVPRRALGKGQDGQPEPPTAAEQALIDEGEAALTGWWDQRQPLPTLRQVLATALLIGRAPLRLFVPDATPGLSVDGDTKLDAALALLFLDAPAPDAAAVLTDPPTQARVGVYGYDRATTAAPFASLLTSGAGSVRAASYSYLDETGATVVREVTQEAGTPQPPSPPLRLGGRLTQHDLTRAVLVSIQVRQMQKGLNLDLTQMLRNVNLAGSLERIFLNVKPPGRRVDATGADWVDGQSTGVPIFIPESLPTGVSISAFLETVEATNERGEIIGRAAGTVNYRDPVPVTTFAESKALLYEGILEECAQLHALISGDATASGESRKQARAEFAASLNVSKIAVDEAGRWLLETLLALAATFAGTPGRFDALRCEFGAVVDAGPLSSEDRKQIVAEHEAGVISTETTMSRLQVDDVDAELARLSAEREEKQANASAAFGSAFNAGDLGAMPPATPGQAPAAGQTGVGGAGNG